MLLWTLRGVLALPLTGGVTLENDSLHKPPSHWKCAASTSQD